MQKYNTHTVDVGIASNDYTATSYAQMEEYRRNDVNNSVTAFVNACGSSYQQPVNGWLDDGTPVISSICVGPGQDGNYLFYYRDNLNSTDPVGDLADRIRWATATYATAGRPLFILAFGGLGVYGGYGDFFEFLTNLLSELRQPSPDNRTYAIVGAQEMSRLARLLGPPPLQIH